MEEGIEATEKKWMRRSGGGVGGREAPLTRFVDDERLFVTLLPDTESQIIKRVLSLRP